MSLQARFHRILLIALFVCALIKTPLPLIAQGTEKKSNDEAKSPEALGRLLFEAILDKDRTASLYCPEEVTNERIEKVAKSADEKKRLESAASMKKVANALLFYE